LLVVPSNLRFNVWPLHVPALRYARSACIRKRYIV